MAHRDLKAVEEMIGGVPPRITSEADQDRAISKLAEVIQAFSDLARLYPGEVEVWVGLGSDNHIKGTSQSIAKKWNFLACLKKP